MKIPRRQLPLNALRAYEAAARHCHLKSAAEELGVTQGAISQQIKILEEKLRRPLFQRHNRSLQLTPEGKRFLGTINDAFNRISDAVMALDADAESMEGELCVCSTPSIINNLLMPIMGRFNREFPEVTLRILQFGPLTKTLPEEMDICVCFGLPDTGKNQVRKLYDTEMFPVASPRLMSNRARLQQSSELLDLPLLHDRANAWVDWFRGEGIAEHRSRTANIYYRDTYQAIHAAQLGQGVALAEYYEVANDLAAGRLVKPYDKSIEIEAGGYLITRPEAQQSLRSRVFVEFIDQHLEQLGGYFKGIGVTAW
jgi:LysR family glycine cleavage system transcriptional activator